MKCEKCEKLIIQTRELQYAFMIDILETRMRLLVNGILPSIRKEAGLSAEFKLGGTNLFTGEKMILADDEKDLPLKYREMLYFTRGAMQEVSTMLTHLPNSLAYDPENADLIKYISEPTDLMKKQEEE